MMEKIMQLQETNWLYDRMKKSATEVDKWPPFLKLCFNIDDKPADDTVGFLGIDFDNKNVK